MDITRLKKIRALENFHILFWLIKDLSWIKDYPVLGTSMIFPTLGLGFYLAYQSKDDKFEMLHALAVCFWIIANSIWMIGELFYEDSLRKYANPFFILGLILILFSYLSFLRRYIKKS